MYMYIFIFIYLILLSDDLGIMWFSISSFRSPGKVCTISLKIRGGVVTSLPLSRSMIVLARVSDFAHLIGACRPRASLADSALSEKVRTYRKGIFVNCKALLSKAEIFDELEKMVFGTRIAPSGVFSLLWSSFLAYLEELGETECAKLLVAHYLQSSGGLWEASWRHSPLRILAGTASGSQAQESWHFNRLIPGVSGLKQALPGFISDLTSFAGCRADQWAKHSGKLYNVPGSQWDSELWQGLSVACASKQFFCNFFWFAKAP